MFGSAFLDTFQSFSNILSLLKNNGYETDDISLMSL